MGVAEIKEIARLIAQAQFVESLPYYITLIALVLIGAASAAYCGAFFKMRGEADARRRDREQILKELKITTDAVETIQKEIRFDDWNKKEYLQVRRKKLEELLEAVFELEAWIDRGRDHYLFNGENPGNDRPISTVRTLQGLYFPELLSEITKLIEICRFMNIAGIAVLQERIAQATEQSGFDWKGMQPNKSLVATVIEHQKKLIQAINDVETRSSEIMATLF